MMRRVLSVAGVGLALLGLAPTVYAHAQLLSADPPPGSTVSSPTQIRLTFSEPLVPGSTVAVYAAAFQPVPGLTTVVEGTTLRLAVATRLAPGDYTVQWAAVSADGHSTQGSYQFRVRQPSGLPVWGLAAVLAAGAAGAVMGWRRRRGSKP